MGRTQAARPQCPWEKVPDLGLPTYEGSTGAGKSQLHLHLRGLLTRPAVSHKLAQGMLTTSTSCRTNFTGPPRP